MASKILKSQMQNAVNVNRIRDRIIPPDSTDGYALVADSTTPTGLDWAAFAGSNYYVTGGTYDSGNEEIDFSGVTGFPAFSVDVSALVAGGTSPGGSDNDVQYKTGATTLGGVTLAKGKILSANSSGVPTVLAVGTDGYALVADSSAATGLNWAANSDANYYTSSVAMGTDGILTGTIAGGGSNWTSTAFNVITDGQIAYGQSTAGLTTGSAKLTFDGTDMTIATGSKLKFGDSLRYIEESGDHLYIRNSETGGNIELNAKNDMKFSIDGVQKLHMDSLGHVGIGLTNPQSFSDVFSVQLSTDSGWPIGFTNAAEDVIGALRTDQGDNYIALASKTESDIRLFYNDNEANTALIVKGSGATAGNVGIGTTAPDSMLEISTDTATDHLKLTSEGSTANPIKLIFEKGASEQGIIEYNRNGDLELYNTDNDGGVMIDGSASGGGDFYVSHAGNVGIGTTSPEGILHTANNSGVNIFQRSNDSASYGTNFYIRKSRGTVGSESDTQSGDLIGQIGFSPYYGDYDNYAASISAKVTGTLGTDTTPGYLAFSTAAAGANTVTQRMAINESGQVGIGTASPSYALDVYDAGTSHAVRFKNASSNGYILRLDAGGDSSNIQFQTDHIIASQALHLMNDNANLYVRTSGYKFGVGTGSPKTSMSLVGALSIQERADHETTNADWGQLWVKNSTPNKIYFTDDAGTDFDLTATGSATIAGTVSANRIPYASSADTLADSPFYYNTSDDRKVEPVTDAYYDLGDSDKAWRRLYVGTAYADAISMAGAIDMNTFNLTDVGSYTGSGDITITKTTDSAVTLLGDANRSGQNSHVVAMRGKWDGTTIGTMMIMTGPDTTNKDDGQLAFYTASAGTQAERMRIDETGNVGIGTTAPAEKLDVQGSILVDPSTGSDTAGTSAGIKFNAQDDSGVGWNLRLGDSSDDGDFNIDRLYSSTWYKSASIDRSTGDFIWYDDDGSTAKMIWDASTNKLGIGTTAPAEYLEINSSADDDPAFKLYNSRSPSASGALILQHRGSTINQISTGSAATPFRWTVQSTEMMRLDDTGLGIGTTAPSTKLDVVGSITAGANSYTTISDNEYDVSSGNLLFDVAGDITLDADGADIRLSDGGTQYGKFRPDSNNFAIHSSVNDANMLFKGEDGGSTITAMTIDMANAGRVGIGTTAPETQLHITGDMTVEGSDILFGTTDKVKFKRGGTNYFQMLTSGNSAAGLQSLGLLVSNSYGSTPQRGTVTLQEITSAPTEAEGYGFLWVSGSVPNKLYYTDDAGTDFDLTLASTATGTIGGSIADNQVAFGATTANSIEGSANFTFDGTDAFLDTSGGGKLTLGAATEYIQGSGSDIRIYASDNVLISPTDDLNIRADDVTIETTSASEYVRFDGGTQRVGIGTTSPDQYLHVKAGTTDQALKLESTDGNVDATFTDSNGSGIIRFTDDRFEFYTDSGYSNNPINFWDDKVGLGTQVPSQKLQLQGDSTYFSILAADGSEGVSLGTASSGRGIFYLKGATGGNAIYIDSNGNSYFDGGDVGIGTTSPSNKLHVLSTTTPQARVAYDGTYYMTTEVSSAGSTTWTNQKSFRFTGEQTDGTFQIDQNSIVLNRDTDSAASALLKLGDHTTYDQFSILEDQRGSSATNGLLYLRSKKTGNAGYATVALGAISGSNTSYLYVNGISTNEALRFDTNSKSHAFDIAKAGYVSVGGAVDSTNQFTVVGTTHLSGAATVTGVLSATAKSFNIEHPLYKDKRLVHGSLEGPEHGIYIRGTIESKEYGCEIELPEYWEAMCDDYTVQLTPHGPYTVYINEKQKDKVMVASTSREYKFDYYVVGSRTDETLEVVQDA